MQKKANTNYAIHDILTQRWSPRAFADQKVEKEKIYAILEAARWAPSAANGQPWVFFVAERENTASFEKLASCLDEGNLRWASLAPLLILSAARFIRSNGKQHKLALYDVGLSIACLTFQAQSMGLFVHQMAGFDKDKARQLFSIPETHQPATMIAVGYPGDPQQLPQDLYEREMEERKRKPLSEFVFADDWNNAFPGLK